MDHSWGYGTDQRLRDENQDCHGLFEFPDFTLAVVCDGMGGHVGGAQASALAVRTIYDVLSGIDTTDIPGALTKALEAANQAIYEAARKNHRLMGMGTTVVAAAVTDDMAYLAHVGDSRAYLVRGTQVRQITRDHTMVNLFVDAELLTPEDAATHPEAHVLSRSLGVERTVDVELSEPMPMEPDDVVFVCSDGVHVVVTDWELANVDWGAPHEGVQHVLNIVAAREGDDNASAVAVLVATSFEDVPPTDVPDPDQLNAPAPQSSGFASPGVTAVPMDELDHGRTIIPDMGDHSVDEPAPVPDSGLPAQPSYIVYDEPEPAPMPDVRSVAKSPKDDDTKKAAPAGAGASKKRLLVFGLLFMVVAAGGLVAGGMLAGDESTVPIAPLEPAPAGDAMVHIDDPSVQAEPAAPAEVVEEVVWVFQPELPPPPRRLRHTPLEFTQPPPGGQLQWLAVQAARQHKCAESLETVGKAMKNSIDHASLYSQAWFCFNETHQRPLIEGKAETWEDFIFLLEHFEGALNAKDEQTEDIKKLPVWFRPAPDGIEFRLQQWNDTDRDNRIREVMADRLGEPTLADHLANDVLLELAAAEGLAAVEEPNDRVIAWWARRVYVVSASMNGRIGRLLENHRPELVTEIRERLKRIATPQLPDVEELPPVENPEGEDVEVEPPPEPEPIPVPEMVAKAYEVGSGSAEAPDPTKPVKRTGPVKPKEPELEDLTDVPDAVIHRGRRTP